MKKSVIFCLCMAVIALFSACNKDPEGVFNPSKKIQKIYTVENGVQQLYEVWHWDGDLLKSIDDYSDDLVYTTTFKYDGNNRLIAMDDAEAHGEFIYEGNKIEKVVLSVNGTEMGSYEFEHKGNKISQIKIEFQMDWDDFEWDKAGIINPLRFVIPEVCTAVESAMKRCSKEKDLEEEVILDLHWGGNNVKSMDVSYSGLIGMVKETVELTYDNKNNPSYGLLALLSTDAVANLFVNKNNPLTILTSLNGSVFDKQIYTYEYEDDYPVKVIHEDVENEGTPYEQRYSNTTIYEY